jgi:hypothetical protein
VTISQRYFVRACTGVFYFLNDRGCADTPNRTVTLTSAPGDYTRTPVSCIWTFPSTVLEFGSTFSPVPAHGTVALSE